MKCRHSKIKILKLRHSGNNRLYIKLEKRKVRKMVRVNMFFLANSKIGINDIVSWKAWRADDTVATLQNRNSNFGTYISQQQFNIRAYHSEKHVFID